MFRRASAVVRFGLFVALLLAVRGPAVAQAPDLAAIFDSTDAELNDQFATSTGEQRIAVGLVLADILTTEAGAPLGLEQLEKLAGADDIEKMGLSALADYARSIRAAALLRLGQSADAHALAPALAMRADAIREPSLRSRVFDHLAFLTMRRGQSTAAYAFARKASQAAALSGSDYLQARSYGNEALIVHMSGMFGEAIERFQAAREHAQQVLFRATDEVIDFNMGLPLLQTGDYNSALRAFTSGVEWAESHGDRHRLLIAHTHRAMALVGLGRSAEAVSTLETGLQAQDRGADADGMANAVRVLAQAHLELDAFENARDAIERGLAIAASSGNAMRRSQLQLVEVALLRRQGDLAGALERARALASEASMAESPEYAEALRGLAELEAQSGQHERAYETVRLAEDVEQRAKGAGYAQRLAMLSVANDVRLVEQRRVDAERKADALAAVSRQTNQLSVGVIVVLILIGLAGFLARERNVQRRLILEQRRVSEELESQVADRTRALRREMDERLAVERDRIELRESLVAADKLGALGQLTGGVAHDFNNLLTVINGAADILMSKPDLASPERKRLAEAIAAAGETGAEICRGLLAYARRQPLNPEVFDAESHILAQRSLLEQTLGEGGDLELDLESARVEVDPSQLTTAVINLLSNARDAMGGQGDVIITLRGRASERDARVLIEVADTGCGMTAEQVERASEPFYSTKESTLATGLGLSAVHGFMQQSGGDLEIDSSPGQGTRMRLLLPPADGDARSEALPNESLAVTPCLNIRTLLVDDNDAVASMLSSMLKLLGHSVSVARDPQGALAAMETGDFDLLISDVVMPGAMNGVQLADRVCEERPELRVLLLSGYVDDNVPLPYPFLGKPFSQELFRQKLEQVMAKRPSSAKAR